MEAQDEKGSESSLAADANPLDGSFRKPQKMVDCEEKIKTWQTSEAFADTVGFIFKAGDKIKGKPISCPRPKSEKILLTMKFLCAAKAWTQEIPPQTQSQRFGNKAFRTWHQKLTEETAPFLTELLGPELSTAGAVEELSTYLVESFGSMQRIDYGTGHELNFAAWMAALQKLGVFTQDDTCALILDVFLCYLDCMRELQRVYWLEPAGSKGVWGLDDYQFLPFVWGAAQLSGHEDEMTPNSIHNDATLNENASEYLYMSCIKFIKTMKTGLFWEHSPLLNDISAVPSWRKVNQGLLKMYDKEVLAKFPVIQHFYFGSVLKFEECPSTHPMRMKRGPPPVL